MNDLITVPICKVIKKPKQFTESGSKPVFQIKYIGIDAPFINKAKLTLSNEKPITLNPFQSIQLYFNVIVITSLPAISLVYGCTYFYRQGLSVIINPIPTNDTYLSVTIVNKKSIVNHFKADSLTFYCQTILK